MTAACRWGRRYGDREDCGNNSTSCRKMPHSAVCPLLVEHLPPPRPLLPSRTFIMVGEETPQRAGAAHPPGSPGDTGKRAVWRGTENGGMCGGSASGISGARGICSRICSAVGREQEIGRMWDKTKLPAAPWGDRQQAVSETMISDVIAAIELELLCSCHHFQIIDDIGQFGILSQNRLRTLPEGRQL